MRSLLAVALILAMPTLALPAGAQTAYFLDGNQLHEICLRDEGRAALYLGGVEDGLSLSRQAPAYCLPADITTDVMANLMCSFLADNPQDRNGPAAHIATAAYAIVWPCS